MQEEINKLQCYNRLRCLLQQGQNEELLQQIKQFDSIHNHQSSINNYSQNSIHFMGDPYKSRMSEIRRDVFDFRPPLYYTEKAVIAEIAQLIAQIDQIESDLSIDSKILRGLNKELHTVYSCQAQQQIDGSQKHANLFGQTLNNLQAEIGSMEERINLIQYLDGDIDMKLQQVRQQHKILEQQIISKKAQFEQSKLRLTTKQILSSQINYLSQNNEPPLKQLKHPLAQLSHQEMSQMIIEILTQRLALEKEVTEEQKEKEEFSQTLHQFQSKYSQVRDRNQQLRAKIEQGKRSIIFERMQV